MAISLKPSAILDAFVEKYPSIKNIRCVFHNYSNVPLSIFLTLSRARDLAENPSNTGVLSATSGLGYRESNTGQRGIELMTQPGSDELVPVWDTLKPTHRADLGTMVCSLKETYEPGSEFARDPRTVLRKTVDRAREEFGLDFKVGLEIEFSLLVSGTGSTYKSVWGGPNTALATAVSREPSFEVMYEVVAALEEAGVKVWKYHVESGAGIYEICTAPLDPITAIDDVICAHELIRSVAKKHGLHATLHPRPFEDGPSIGQHFHLSMNKDELSDSFLAGMLAHLRGISAILQGGHDSFGRNNLSFGFGEVVWARGKLTPIRRIGTSHFELRVPDALFNPYLQLASVIGSGLDGVRQGLELKVKENKRRSLEPMDDEAKRQTGMIDQLPATLSEAVEAMEEDAVVLTEILGKKCFETVLWHQKREVEGSGRMDRADRVRGIMQHI